MEQDKVTQLKAALELTPDNEILRNLYIDALIESKNWAEAEKEIKIVLKTISNLETLLKLANTYYFQNKTSEGIVMLESLLEQNPRNTRIIKELISFYLAENDKQNAFKYFKTLKSIDPGFADEELETKLGDFINKKDNQDDSDDNLLRISLQPDEDLPVIPIEKPDITFAHVGGMSKVKEDIGMKIINPIKHSSLFKQYGKKIGGGILMYGPPGCGKTYLAKATAGEINATFISIGINDVLNMFMGQSEKQLHKIFEYARNHTPSIIFFDEVDALGASRSDMRNNAGRNIINQFLLELDGISSSNDGVLILGATNAPWYLDSAFKRPGRFDSILFIPPPDTEARKEIISILIKDKPFTSINLTDIAKATNNFTGADLKALIDLSIEEKLKIIMQTGKESPITTKEIMQIVKKIRPSSLEWFETAKNYAVYSNQGGLYDDILKYLNIK